jgi:MATE family multidrug resistance protein
MPSLFVYLGQQPEIIDLTEPYLHAIAWGLLPNFILIVLMELVMGIGHTRVLLVLTIFDVLAAIILSYVLIFGLYGFPKLGIAGSGWGISISNLSSMLGLAFYCSFNRRYQPYFKALFTFKKLHYFYELIKIGLPLGLMYCIEVAYFFGLTLLAGQYGHEVMAANQIALQYLGVMIGVLFSISQAITVRMGHLIGSKNRSSAKRTCAIGLIISVGIALWIGLFELNYPKYMIALDFNVDTEKNQHLIQYALHFLIFTVVFQIFEAIRLTFLAGLRALKDTYYCLWTSILTFWFIALPLGYIFSSYLALGVYGLWYGALVAIVIGCFFLYKRVVSKLSN